MNCFAYLLLKFIFEVTFWAEQSFVEKLPTSFKTTVINWTKEKPTRWREFFAELLWSSAATCIFVLQYSFGHHRYLVTAHLFSWTEQEYPVIIFYVYQTSLIVIEMTYTKIFMVNIPFWLRCTVYTLKFVQINKSWFEFFPLNSFR